MEFWSEKAKQLIRRLDEEIEKAYQCNEKRIQRRQGYLPAEDMGSISSFAPEGLPIGFYSSYWFNNCTAGQKRVLSDSPSIAFFPDSSKSLLGKQHPNERLCDQKFTQKYWDEAILPCNISHKIANDEDLDDSVNEGSDGFEHLAADDLDQGNENESIIDNKKGEFSHTFNKDTEMEDSEDISKDNMIENSNNVFLTVSNEWAS
ncbi:hypothetical protein O181_007941 [Austropuccinia psidii MF-1]|uniref:Uncharacterized protein n=1 Tax=Austropuccinia psidii MF-1 TaxID=1389203 RepID=A0A9Q3BLR4_9BASI|nr:hypothetical protein [Austropuccinia psidii MF-1]